MKKDIIQKIIAYIKAKQAKGFEAQTIVENLKNEFILEEIIG